MVVPVWYALNRLRWGLRLRSCGENPEATRSLGVSVPQYRYQGVLLSGAFAGLSGAFLAAEVIGNWREGQTLGLGFIALAALILSNWNPIRLMFFAWLFGFAVAIPLRLNDAPVISALPPQFIRMIPYIVTIVAIAGFVGAGAAPCRGRQGLRGRRRHVSRVRAWAHDSRRSTTNPNAKAYRPAVLIGTDFGDSSRRRSP